MASTLTLLVLLPLALFSSVTCKKGEIRQLYLDFSLGWTSQQETGPSSLVLSAVCGPPPITDGIDELALKRVYEAGEAVTLACEQGYTPSTSNPQRITCTATGEWTPSDLACSREFNGKRIHL